jgi:hypothetical protein
MYTSTLLCRSNFDDAPSELVSSQSHRHVAHKILTADSYELEPAVQLEMLKHLVTPMLVIQATIILFTCSTISFMMVT